MKKADNQVAQIRAAGFDLNDKRIVTETVSGSSAIEQRPGFTKLIDRLEDGDVLVVTKLDRLGRNAVDVTTSVGRLAKAGVRVHCLGLGGADLTSAAGKMIMQVVGAMAEFERDLIIERTQAGLERAKANGTKSGKAIGRPRAADDDQADQIRAKLAGGATITAVAAEYGVSRATIMRIGRAAAWGENLITRTPLGMESGCTGRTARMSAPPPCSGRRSEPAGPKRDGTVGPKPEWRLSDEGQKKRT